MESPLEAARELYEIAKSDAAFCSQLQTAYRAAVVAGFMTKGGLDSIVNASKNGSNLTVIQALKEGDRIRAMRWALKWVADGAAPVVGRSFGRF